MHPQPGGQKKCHTRKSPINDIPGVISVNAADVNVLSD
jgi:hypothetical protein